MDIVEQLKKRRSIRKFIEKPVPAELVGKLLTCALNLVAYGLAFIHLKEASQL